MTDQVILKDQAARDAADRVADYEHGWSSEIEQEFAPKGLSEDTVRFISAKKNEPEWMLEWRLKAFRHWLTMTPPDWAKLNVPPIDYQDAYYYAEPKAKPKLGSLDEVDPEILRGLRKARHPAGGAEGARRRRGRAAGRGRCGVRFGQRRHHLPQGAGSRRRDLPLDQRGDARISRAGAQVARQGRADARQLLRGARTARSFRTAPSSTSPRGCAARWS